MILLINKIISSLRAVFFPAYCPVCGNIMNTGEKTLCTKCRWNMPYTDYCYDPMNSVTELFSGIIPIEKGCALLYFDKNSKYRHIVHTFKYYGNKRLAHEMGELFGSELVKSQNYTDIDLLVPIPIHPIRRMNRGYNQSEELCRGMGKAMGVVTDHTSVQRIKNNDSQVGKESGDRMRNVEGIFKVANSEALRGKHILIVDDVLTTGATIESCCREIVSQVREVKISIATLSMSDYRINH